MPSRSRLSGAFLILLLMSFSLFGCSSGDDSSFNMQALAAGRLLFASSGTNVEGVGIGLFTVDGYSGSGTYQYASANLDFTGPSISTYPGEFWLISFGKNRLELLNTFTTDRQSVNGLGAQQRALAFDNDSPVRFAFMDGSPSSGWNISVQTSLTGQPAYVTSGASDSVSYWTPSWSPDGEWIVYAMVTGTDTLTGELWRVRPNGSGAELLPISTTELPTYPVFSPDGTEIFVPGDFTSYKIDDGRVGTFDNIRSMQTFQDQLAAMGYEVVGSPITGAVHPGDEVTEFRHTFPISACWATGDWLYFDALVASNYGSTHEVEGVAIFVWKRISQTLFLKVPPVPQSATESENYSISILHPTIIP